MDVVDFGVTDDNTAICTATTFSKAVLKSICQKKMKIQGEEHEMLLNGYVNLNRTKQITS